MQTKALYQPVWKGFTLSAAGLTPARERIRSPDRPPPRRHPSSGAFRMKRLRQGSPSAQAVGAVNPPWAPGILEGGRETRLQKDPDCPSYCQSWGDSPGQSHPAFHGSRCTVHGVGAPSSPLPSPCGVGCQPSARQLQRKPPERAAGGS